MENRYNCEVKKPCKSLRFGLIKNKKSGVLDWEPLETIASQTKETVSLLISLVLSFETTTLSTPYTSYVASIKLIAIFIIMCASAHQNNSNYILLFIAMYFYSASAQVNAIILFNYLGILVLYSILIRKLKGIPISSMVFIKEQVSYNRLVDTWNNFEYRENVAIKRIEDIS